MNNFAEERMDEESSQNEAEVELYRQKPTAYQK